MSVNKKQSGFTLIELVVVIVILGILAATAIPRFVDLSDDAAQAAVNGVAGAVSSAASINYAARKANTAKGATVTSCAQALALVDGLPTGKYSVATVSTGTTLNDGVVGDCVIAGEKAKTSTAKVIGTPAS